MLIGDVLAVVALLAGMSFSAWAVLLGSSLLFKRRAEIAKSLVQYAPFRTFFIGFLLLAIIGFISIALISVPLPAIKFFGWSGILVVLSLASIGAPGMVLLVADRLKSYDPDLSNFASLGRAGLFIVCAGLVPLLGLFVVFPAVLAMGLGCAVQSIFMRETLQPTHEAL